MILLRLTILCVLLQRTFALRQRRVLRWIFVKNQFPALGVNTVRHKRQILLPDITPEKL